MKRKGLFMMAAILVLTVVFAAGAAASDGLKTVAARLFPNAAARVDGAAKPLAPPLLYRDKIYVQLESLEKALGMEMTWDADENRLSVSTGRTANPPSSGNVARPVRGTASTGSNKTVGEMRFSTIVKYEATYKDKVYPILANEYMDTIYFRVSDVQAMGIDVKGMDVVEEKNTKDQFIEVHKLEGLWDEMPFFNLLKTPVVSGYVTTEQINAMQAYTSNAHAIKALGNNQFEVLAERGDKQLYVYTLKLNQLNNSSSSYWYVSSVQYKSVTYES